MHALQEEIKIQREVSRLSRKLSSGTEERSKDILDNDSQEEESEDKDSDIDECESSKGQGYRKKKFASSKSHPGSYCCHLAQLKKIGHS